MTQADRFLVVHTDIKPNDDYGIETERLAAIGARFLPTPRSATEDELI